MECRDCGAQITDHAGPDGAVHKTDSMCIQSLAARLGQLEVNVAGHEQHLGMLEHNARLACPGCSSVLADKALGHHDRACAIHADDSFLDPAAALNARPYDDYPYTLTADAAELDAVRDVLMGWGQDGEDYGPPGTTPSAVVKRILTQRDAAIGELPRAVRRGIEEGIRLAAERVHDQLELVATIYDKDIVHACQVAVVALLDEPKTGRQ